MKNWQTLTLYSFMSVFLFSCTSEEAVSPAIDGTETPVQEVVDVPSFNTADFVEYNLEDYNMLVTIQAPADAAVKPGNMSSEIFHSAVIKKGDFFIGVSSEIDQLPEDSDAELAYKDVMSLMELTPEFELVEQTASGSIYKREGGYSFYCAFTKEERLYVIQPAFNNEGYSLPVIEGMFAAAQSIK